MQTGTDRQQCFTPFYNNAYAEAFGSRLKTELLDGGSFLGLAEARLEVGHYIAYYNAERRHPARLPIA